MKLLYIKERTYHKYKTKIRGIVKAERDRLQKIYELPDLRDDSDEAIRSTAKKTKKEMRQELKDAGIEVHHFTGLEKMTELYNQYIAKQ